MANEDTLPPPGAAGGGTPEVGGFLGPYRLVRRIGEGGFGEVFEAEQTHPIRRRVAVKVIRPGMASRDIVARFEAERQALALMDHPHVAHVYDAGSGDGGVPYFVMELVDGVPITQFCDDHRLPLDARLQLFEQVCQAVQHAHGKGLIHRDLKPGNVLVSLEAGQPFARIIDFGIARAVAGALGDRTRYTVEQQLLGTPLYMSPEQAEGSLDIDTRSDIYALGTMLYELLTGETPLDALALRNAALAEIQRAIRETDPPRPSTRLAATLATHGGIASRFATDARTLGRQVRGELDWIVMKALEKERARRYGSAGEFAEDVRRHRAGEPVLAAPPSARYRVGKFVRRHRLLVGAGAAVAASLVAGFGVALWQARVATERAAQLLEVTEFQAAMLDRLQLVELGHILDTAVLAQREAATSSGDEDAPDPAAAGAESGAAAATAPASGSATDETFENAWARIDKVAVAAEFLDKAVLAPSAAEARERYPDQPRVESRLTDAMAGAYAYLGDYEQALALRKRQLERSEAAGDREDVIGASIRIAELQRITGDYDAAEESLLALRGQCVEELGDHRYCPDAVEQLGDVYLDQARAEEAEAAYRDEVAMLEASADGDADDLFAALHDVGYALMQQGKLDEAEPWFRRSREQAEIANGADSAEVASADKSLATLDLRRGRFAEAEAGYRRVLDTYTRLSGGNHPDTGSAANDVGVALYQQGRVAEAVTFMDRALKSFEASYGPMHIETLIAVNNTCILLLSLERTDDAMPRCVRAEAGFRTMFGAGHPNALAAAMGLAGAEVKSDRVQAGRDRLARALPLAREAFAEANPVVLGRLLLSLANAETKLGDVAAARRYFDEGHAIVSAAAAANEDDRRRLAEIGAALGVEPGVAPGSGTTAPR